MSIGLARGTVQLQLYDPRWLLDFEHEKQNLQTVFGRRIVAIEHIGSTAVPGLPAKPIIDMVVAVRSFNEIDHFIGPLQRMGYEYIPARMFADRKFFPKGPESHRTHHVNLVLENDVAQWIQPIAFRDYLRTHAAAREQYARIKTNLANKYASDRDAYTRLKGDFITSVVAKLSSNVPL